MNNIYKPKLQSVEGIRGLACIMVFLSHLSSTFAPSMHTGNVSNARTPIDILMHSSPFAFIYSGAAAVGIFFVLSGFILSYCILERGSATLNAAGMTVKRYFRLMPPALISCLIAYIALKYLNFDKSAFADWSRNYHISSPSLLDAIYQGMISSFTSGTAPYNWSLWTMKIEFFGSMAVFFICCIMPHIRQKKTLVFICMIIPYFMNLKPGDEIYFSSFFAGVMIYLFKSDINKFAGIFILLLGLFLCGYHVNGFFYKDINALVELRIYNKAIDNYILFNNIGGFLVVFSVLKTDCISKLFSGKWLVLLGSLSFSVYVIHQPIMHVTTPLFFNYAHDNGASYSISSLISSLATVIIVYLFSYPYYKYVDKFSVTISNAIKNKVINN